MCCFNIYGGSYLFYSLDLIDDDGSLLRLGGEQLLIESVHGVRIVLHDVPRVVISTDNPHVSCLWVLVLDERSFPSHVVDWFAHELKIKGKKGGETHACTPRQSEKHLTLILERDSLGIRCFSRVVATLLRRLAVRVPHAEACFAAL